LAIPPRHSAIERLTGMNLTQAAYFRSG